MVNYSKIVAYCSEQQVYEELKNKQRIKISRQKTDEVFSSLKTQDTLSSRFIHLVAEDPILRTFFFLKSGTGFQLDRKYPVSESFPLILDPEYDIIKRIVESYTKEREEAEERQKELNEELKDVYNTTSYESLDLVITDSDVVRSLSRRPTERKEALNRSFKRHEPKIKELFSNYINFLGEIYPQLQVLQGVLTYVGDAPSAERNGKILHHAVDIPQKADSFFASMNKLASQNIVKIQTRSLCLDCYFKHKDEPFASIQSNLKEIELLRTCPRCKDEGVFHNLDIAYPAGLHKMILPGANWLQEVIIGYSLSSLDEVKKVYIHKKINMAPLDGPQKKATESDISLITNDGRLILVEITKQTDMDNIQDSIDRKTKNLIDNEIPYDGIAFITPYAKTDEFWTLSKKRARIFMANHIPNINEYILEELIKK